MQLEVVFGKVLRDFRKQANLSQEALALECGLDRTFISLLERGLRQPTLKSLFKISNILRITPSHFIETVEAKIEDGQDIEL